MLICTWYVFDIYSQNCFHKVYTRKQFSLVLSSPFPGLSEIYIHMYACKHTWAWNTHSFFSVGKTKDNLIFDSESLFFLLKMSYICMFLAYVDFLSFLTRSLFFCLFFEVLLFYIIAKVLLFLNNTFPRSFVQEHSPALLSPLLASPLLQ